MKDLILRTVIALLVIIAVTGQTNVWGQEWQHQYQESPEAEQVLVPIYINGKTDPRLVGHLEGNSVFATGECWMMLDFILQHLDISLFYPVSDMGSWNVEHFATNEYGWTSKLSSENGVISLYLEKEGMNHWLEEFLKKYDGSDMTHTVINNGLSIVLDDNKLYKVYKDSIVPIPCETLEQNGTIMVQLRPFVKEIFNLSVTWYPQERKAEITEGNFFEFFADSDIANVNRIEKILSSPCKISGDRLYVSLESLTEIFGVPVHTLLP